MKETIERTLSCNFSDEEKVKMAKEMAQANVRKAGIEMALKESQAQYKSEIAAQEAIVARLSQKIHDGYEYRLVECECEYNTPERGKKTLKRIDTGETWIENMTDKEKSDLFMNTKDEEENKKADGEQPKDDENRLTGEEPAEAENVVEGKDI